MGYTIYQSRLPSYISNHYTNHEVDHFVGTITEKPKSKKSISTTIKVSKCGSSIDSLYSCEGKIITYFKLDSLSENLKFGDQIYFNAQVNPIFENRNPNTFDYKKYLFHKGIYDQVFIDSSQWTRLSENNLPVVQIFTSDLRFKSIDIFQKYLITEDRIAIATAMILGYRQLASDELLKSFSDTGSIHVLAVSGLHVGILSMLILFLFSWIKSKMWYVRFLKGITSITIIWFFVLITGAAPAVIRAATMFSIYFIGDIFQRDKKLYNVIGVSAFVMLLFDPNMLFQVSFQFSYLALISIIFFYERIKRWILLDSIWLDKIWSLVVVALSAQVLVFPLTIFYFHKFSTSFWISGIVAIPMATIILSLGFAMLVFEYSGLSILNETILSKLMQWSIDFFAMSVELIQAIPYSYLDHLYYDNYNVIFLYLAIFSVMYGLSKRSLNLILLCLGFLFLNTAYSTFQKHQYSKQKKLIIYDQYKHSIVDVFQGHTCLTWNSKDFPSKNADYLNKMNRIANGIKSVDSIELNSNIFWAPNLYILGDRVLMKKLIDTTKCQMLKHPDYYWIHKSNLTLDFFDYLTNDTQLIIDGSVYKSQHEKILTIADSLNFKVHDTRAQGAFILDY